MLYNGLHLRRRRTGPAEPFSLAALAARGDGVGSNDLMNILFMYTSCCALERKSCVIRSSGAAGARATGRGGLMSFKIL